MKHLDITEEQLKDFESFPIEGSFQFINLLKFKKVIEETEMTGEEAYTQYMYEAFPFFKKTKAKVLYSGKVNFTAIGPDTDQEWDKILIVEYADKASFLEMIHSEGYPAHLRKRALEDSRLFLCTTD